jgi:uncharacterized membrane protein YeaQ/YmgE (transglycosylase-associated protein family)
MSYLPIILQLVTGAVGANALGAAVKSLNLGPVGNTIAGLIGGLLGGQVLASLNGGAAAHADLNVGAIVGSIVGGAAGGGLMTAIVAYLKIMFAKPT